MSHIYTLISEELLIVILVLERPHLFQTSGHVVSIGRLLEAAHAVMEPEFDSLTWYWPVNES